MSYAIRYLVILLYLTLSWGFKYQNGVKIKISADNLGSRQVTSAVQVSKEIESPYDVIETLASSLPSEESSTLRLRIKGGSVGTAIFRAELKKELTFFYGCGAKFTTPFNGCENEAEIVAEGKVASLKRFVSIWVKGVCSPINTRKPNFQGPPLIIEVLEGEWSPYSSKLGRKFHVFAGPVPSIATTSAGDGTLEARSMMDSDCR